MPAASAADSMIPVSLATLCPGEIADFPLFIRSSPHEPFRLYRDKNVELDREDLARLSAHGVENLYVSLDDHQQYQQYLRDHFQDILHDRSLPGEQRCGCLNEFVRSTLADAFARGDAKQAIDAAQDLALQTVSVISQDDAATGQLLNVLHHDFHTFTHSANVSYYCVMLARGLGIRAEDELREIATGAMLHDLGKLNIPEKILKKPARLSDDEAAVIKRHPTEGFRLLAAREDLTYAQLMMVYQHHERLDGTGYPVGIVGEHIHPWAQICAVVDIYEALTSNRPYRRGLDRKTTFEILDREAGSHINAEMWECWKKIIQTA